MNNKWLTRKAKIIIAIVMVAVLSGAFIWGGNYANHPALGETKTQDTLTTSPNTKANAGVKIADTSTAKVEAGTKTEVKAEVKTQGQDSAKAMSGKSVSGTKKTDAAKTTGSSKTKKDKYQTDPVPKGKPKPVEPQDAVVKDKALTCTLSVRCDTILDHMDLLDEAKHDLVPQDGVIFPATKVTFYEGESVFNVLVREMKKAGIHMEFENTPIYNSAYIEGINNLYEFDVGELSGWMYKVNGWFPNYGCSRYQLKDGDKVVWVYTCDLGKDVGGGSAAGTDKKSQTN